MVSSIQPRIASPPIAGISDGKTSTGLTPSIRNESVQSVPKSDVVANSQQAQQNLQVSIDRLNQMMRDGGRNLSFFMDHALGRPVVVVRKEDTGEVIRQIPNEAAVSVAHNIELLKGILLNKKT